MKEMNFSKKLLNEKMLLKRQIPIGISKLVMDCIEEDPAQRPPNMMTVVSRLDLMVRSIFGGKIKTSKNASNSH